VLRWANVLSAAVSRIRSAVRWVYAQRASLKTHRRHVPRRLRRTPARVASTGCRPNRPELVTAGAAEGALTLAALTSARSVTAELEATTAAGSQGERRIGSRSMVPRSAADQLRRRLGLPGVRPRRVQCLHRHQRCRIWLLQSSRILGSLFIRLPVLPELALQTSQHYRAETQQL